MEWRGIKTDLAFAASSNLSQKLLGFVVLAILARSLDKSEMGELLFAITLASLFAMRLSFRRSTGAAAALFAN